MHTSLQIEQGTAAITPFDWQGNLQHRSALNFPPTRENATHNTPLKPQRIADRDHSLPFVQFVRISQRQHRKFLGINL